MAQTVERFARKCDHCHKGTNSGYYADGFIYCDQPCLDANIPPEEWDALYEEGGDDFYYTEWDVADNESEFWDAEGNHYIAVQGDTAPCPYCSATGEGAYWVHSLEYVIDAPCHACNGSARVSRDKFADALRDAGEDRRREYLKVYPECSDWV